MIDIFEYSKSIYAKPLRSFAPSLSPRTRKQSFSIFDLLPLPFAVIFTLSLTGSRLVPHHHRTFSIRRCVCVFFFLYPFIRKTSNSMCKLLYCFLVVVAVDCWYRCWCWCCWWCCCCMSSFGSIFHTSLFLYLWALILSKSKQPKLSW